jgi:hypothetical protein
MGAWAADFRQKLYECIDSDLASFTRESNLCKAFAVLPAGIIRYIMEFGVKSGHNDTTIGNSIINAAIAFAAMRRLGLLGSILVAGDDLLIAVQSDFDLKALMDCEREFGIVPEAGKFTGPSHVTFCSGIFLGAGNVYVPNPSRLFARLWWGVKPVGDEAAYQRGVARGLLPTCKHVPIVRLLLSRFDSEGAAGQSDKGYKFRLTEYDLGGVDYASFVERYGLSETAVRDCERWLETLPAEPLLLVHPVLERMAEVDFEPVETRHRFWPDLGPHH